MYSPCSAIHVTTFTTSSTCDNPVNALFAAVLAVAASALASCAAVFAIAALACALSAAVAAVCAFATAEVADCCAVSADCCAACALAFAEIILAVNISNVPVIGATAPSLFSSAVAFTACISVWKPPVNVWVIMWQGTTEYKTFFIYVILMSPQSAHTLLSPSRVVISAGDSCTVVGVASS